MNPTGWFQVAWSSDVAIGQVIPLTYFGTELVAFRGRDGAVSVLDAHCQHLGAHLGRGCVVEKGIQCPFHGWVWDGNGRNVEIPYEAKPNRIRRVRSWPVTERNDSLYVWHDAERRQPQWEVPDAFAALGSVFGDADYFPLTDAACVRYSGVHVHPQVIAENAVDPHHFRFVHRTPHSPVVLREVQDAEVWRAKVGFGRRWADAIDVPGETTNTIEILWSGLGTSFNGEHTSDGLRVIAICATPVDATTSDIFGTYWISAGEGRHEERLAQAKTALPDDIAVWDTQIYLDPPGLSASEAAGFRKLRTWARSFYPEPLAGPA